MPFVLSLIFQQSPYIGPLSMQGLITLGGIAGAFAASWGGVKVALRELERRVDDIEQDSDELTKRVDLLTGEVYYIKGRLNGKHV